jgi:hypothetical protein
VQSDLDTSINGPQQQSFVFILRVIESGDGDGDSNSGDDGDGSDEDDGGGTDDIDDDLYIPDVDDSSDNFLPGFEAPFLVLGLIVVLMITTRKRKQIKSYYF